MTINDFLFGVQVIGFFASLGFIGYEILSARRRAADENRAFARQQQLWRSSTVPGQRTAA